MPRTPSLEARISKLEKIAERPAVIVLVRDGETVEQAIERAGLEGPKARLLSIIDEFPTSETLHARDD